MGIKPRVGNSTSKVNALSHKDELGLGSEWQRNGLRIFLYFGSLGLIVYSQKVDRVGVMRHGDCGAQEICRGGWF